VPTPATPEQKQRGRELLARALVAHGGLERLRRVTDTTLEGDLVLQLGGNELSVRVRQVRKEPLRMRYSTRVAMTENGQAPLHLALFSEEPEIAKMLVVAGADINLRMKSGTTPLMAAATAGLAEMVKLLIERGAEVIAIAEGNRTALKIAREKQNAEIVKMLLAAGAK